MKINSQTKISVLIKHNPAAIDTIAAINPHFKKLKNPILRRVLAPRVSIADAARIGKSTVEVFFDALAKIGFEIDTQTFATATPLVENNPLLVAIIEAGKIKSIDVRSSLQNGNDPFKFIMGSIETLPEGFALEVLNTFEPTPLIKILIKKGYASLVLTEGDVVKTYFLKVNDEKEKVSNSKKWIFQVSLNELETEKIRFQKNCKEIDVRYLEMPLPMVTVLNELEDLPEGHALYVHHKKTPQYLLPELEERKFKTWIAEIAEGNVKILIHR